MHSQMNVQLPRRRCASELGYLCGELHCCGLYCYIRQQHSKGPSKESWPIRPTPFMAAEITLLNSGYKWPPISSYLTPGINGRRDHRT
jgi:hypothetical protein